jgi:hypothetical protein
MRLTGDTRALYLPQELADGRSEREKKSQRDAEKYTQQQEAIRQAAGNPQWWPGHFPGSEDDMWCDKKGLAWYRLPDLGWIRSIDMTDELMERFRQHKRTQSATAPTVGSPTAASSGSPPAASSSSRPTASSVPASAPTAGGNEGASTFAERKAAAIREQRQWEQQQKKAVPMHVVDLEDDDALVLVANTFLAMGGASYFCFVSSLRACAVYRGRSSSRCPFVFHANRIRSSGHRRRTDRAGEVDSHEMVVR